MIDFATLTLVDYGVALVLIVSAILAMLRGMTRELLGLAGWIASILVANYTAPRLGIAINDALNLGGFGTALGWGIPFADWAAAKRRSVCHIAYDHSLIFIGKKPSQMIGTAAHQRHCMCRFDIVR